jgi:tyrosyl-tRNA synthetase
MPLWDDLCWRGLVHQATEEETLAERLDGARVTAYIGFDPTAGSLHVGHLQQLITLRRLRDAGHRVIGLVGGGTGMIGDPSLRSDERNLLTSEQVAANSALIRSQVARLLEGESGVSDNPAIIADNPAIIADNSEWLGSARLLEFLRDVGKHFSVNEMIRKDSVRTRLEGREQSLSFTEFSYMLLQSWDFVQLFDRYGCDLQLGGSDQWGNITEGVDLIRRLRGKPAFGLTSPLVTKADGTKFGKTASGAVWLDPEMTSPYAFYQFWFTTPDGDVASYLRRFTLLSRRRIEELEASLASAPERREAHRALASELTAMVHGADEVGRVEAASAALFSPELAQLDESTLAGALGDAPSTGIGAGRLAAGVAIVEALVETGLARSNREARQHLANNAVHVNNLPAGEDRVLTAEDALHGRWVVLRRGKRAQHVLVVAQR